MMKISWVKKKLKKDKHNKKWRDSRLMRKLMKEDSIKMIFWNRLHINMKLTKGNPNMEKEKSKTKKLLATRLDHWVFIIKTKQLLRHNLKISKLLSWLEEALSVKCILCFMRQQTNILLWKVLEKMLFLSMIH